MSAILAVGPRDLPTDGTVQVWIDSGNTVGRNISVPVDELQVADMDDGESDAAIYVLGVPERRS